uniref:Uncharacterized protein n=1 Tax=Rhizophora mucronata TaxID=61149 RepID=A0A2P2PF82_RHIMU
MVFNKESVQAS